MMQETEEAMQRTPVAVLGTLAEFHSEPIPYSLEALVQLVGSLRPDLLCLDMTLEQWEQRDFGGLPPEYREALLPLAHQTDIVVVPIAGEHPLGEPRAVGWRGRMITILRRWLAYLQRTAPGPAAVNAGWRHHLADLLYELIGMLAGREARRAWRDHRDHLIRQVSEAAQRDPGRRLLIAVNVRYCHHIRNALGKRREIQVVPYWKL